MGIHVKKILIDNTQITFRCNKVPKTFPFHRLGVSTGVEGGAKLAIGTFGLVWSLLWKYMLLDGTKLPKYGTLRSL